MSVNFDFCFFFYISIVFLIIRAGHLAVKGIHSGGSLGNIILRSKKWAELSQEQMALMTWFLWQQQLFRCMPNNPTTIHVHMINVYSNHTYDIHIYRINTTGFR